ncbi:MAG: hypothetical protein LRY73_06330 [Bacillus sp. (in: Bacteria)]|nr:hypothetical protein [Bacillus sp. (in: firmicutes)]
MFFRKPTRREPSEDNKDPNAATKNPESASPLMDSVLQELVACEDVESVHYQSNQVSLLYFPSLCDSVKLEEQILSRIGYLEVEEIPSWLGNVNATEVRDEKEISDEVLKGKVAIFHEKKRLRIRCIWPRISTSGKK